MNNKEIKEIANEITPKIRNRINNWKTLSVEELYAHEKRSNYFKSILVVICIFFVFQQPILTTLNAANSGYSIIHIYAVCVLAIFSQGLLLYAVAAFAFIYYFLLDRKFGYFKKGKEVITKLKEMETNNGL